MFSLFTPQDTRFKNVSTLVVKVTHRCNLDCQYCYEHITKKGDDMSLETFRTLANQTLKNTVKPGVTFLFHGGEPTLLPNDWYEQAIAYARQQAEKYNKTVRFSMQTNLVGISQTKIDLFRKYRIELGVSLDGTADAEESMRGKESKVFQNYLRVRQANVLCGILTTINHSNYNTFDRICAFLVEKANVKHFKANVVTNVGAGYHLPALKAEQIFQAQQAILEYMIATEGRKLTEHNLSVELKRFFATDDERSQMPATLCHEKKCGAGKSVLGVTPKGELLPCGRFQWNDEAYFLGNIHPKVTKNSIRAFDKTLAQFHALVPETWDDCAQCPARKICTYGCQAFIVRSKQQANVDCLPTKMRFAYYEANRERLLPVIQAIRNARKAPRFRVRAK